MKPKASVSLHLPEEFDQAHGQHKDDKEDQQLEDQIDDPVEANHGIESTPLTSQVRVRHGRTFTDAQLQLRQCAPIDGRQIFSSAGAALAAPIEDDRRKLPVPSTRDRRRCDR